MPIRLNNGRSRRLFVIRKDGHQTTLLLKFLFLALVLLSVYGILKSPNLGVLMTLTDEAVFSRPSVQTEATKEIIDNMASSSEETIHKVDDLSSSVLNNNDNSSSQKITITTANISAKEPETISSTRVETLALMYPPGLIGGYRNQVMRFTAFVRHAIENRIPQLLLPSIYFSTTYEKHTTERIFYPIRMKDAFDVEYWNDYAKQTNELPILVESMDSLDCWSSNTNQSSTTARRLIQNATNFVSTIQQYSKALDAAASPTTGDETPPMVLELAKRAEFLKPLKRLSLAITSGHAILKRPRKVGVIPADLNCQHPKVYGGGKGGAGILWNDFLYKIRKEANATVIHSISQALTPAKEWRDVAHQCIHQGLETTTNAPYFALHTRVELEMMRHTCGKTMEMNLTKIFQMVDEFIGNYNQNTTEENHVKRMFMAVSRQGMEEARGKNKTVEETLANENLDTLALRMAEGTDPLSSKPTIVECGESWMKRWYSEQNQLDDNYYGTLIPMVMNFYIATEAETFIGTRGSSWSTDVWTTRFYQGKGERNFIYTKAGIIPVPNNGLPKPHGNCK